MKKMIGKNALKKTVLLLVIVMIALSPVAVTANTVQKNISAIENYILQPQQTNTFEEHWIHFDDGVNAYGIGINCDAFEAAIRITPEELVGYDGWEISGVRWYHSDEGIHSGEIRIYEEWTSTNPGALITSEPYTVTGKGWFGIPLSTPVILNAEEDVWASVKIIPNTCGEYPIGADEGPAVDGKGDWIEYGNGWAELQDFNLDYNWNIHVNVFDGNDTAPPITSYKLDGKLEGDIYRSNVTVTLDAIDYGSGVDYTTYKLDDGEYEVYGTPFVVSGDGEHTVCFYSVDNAGNIEEEKTCAFTIECPIKIEISCGFGVTAIIRNIGREDLTDLGYSITLDGGLILLPVGGKTKGEVDILSGEEVTVKSLVFGFGKSMVTVTAGDAEETVNGFILLFFVL